MTIDFNKVAMEVSIARNEYDSLTEDVENALGSYDYEDFVESILFEFQYDYEILKRIRKAFDATIETLYSK